MNPAYQRAHTLMDLNRPEQALKELQDALAADPENIEILANMAHCNLSLGRNREGEALARQVLKKNPDYAYGHYLLARVEYAAQTQETAIQHLERALRLEPANTNFLELLARCQLSLEEPAKALEAADRGLAADPNHIELLNARAAALAKLGKYQGARSALDAALKNDPNAAATHVTEGWITYNCGNYGAARESFLEALRLDAEDPDARRGLCLCMLCRYALLRPMATLLQWVWPGQRAASKSFVAFHLAVVFALAGLWMMHGLPLWAGVLLGLSVSKVTYRLIADAARPAQYLALRADPLGRRMLTAADVRSSILVVLVLLASLGCAVAALRYGEAYAYAAIFIGLLLTRPAANLFSDGEQYIFPRTRALLALPICVGAVAFNLEYPGATLEWKTLHILLTWAVAELLPWVALLAVAGLFALAVKTGLIRDARTHP